MKSSGSRQPKAPADTPASVNSLPESPIYSMTGFARVGGRVSDTIGFTLSIKSVNHRFLDLHLRIPTGAEALEAEMRRLLKAGLIRGHVELTLSLEKHAGTAAQYDPHIVASYIAAFRAAAREHGLKQEPDLNAVLRLPGVLTQESISAFDDPEALTVAVREQMQSLLASFNAMRAQEGASLAAEIRACLERLSVHVEEVALRRRDIQQAYAERLNQRLTELLEGRFERDRILQEAAILAERSDIQEEIARLRAHIEHFHALLDRGGEVGKKADFLLQEMNREANTLLSKTGGTAGNGTKVTELGLGMKAEIEKAREQVQNLE